MPTDDKPITNPVTDQTAVNVPPASAPGAAPLSDAPAAGSLPTDLPAADAPKVEDPLVPGAAPLSDAPAAGSLPTDLPPKPIEEGTDTGNQGGIPPVATGM